MKFYSYHFKKIMKHMKYIQERTFHNRIFKTNLLEYIYLLE